MAVGIGEIEPAAAIPAVDFAGAPAGWIGPIVEISFADSIENRIEVRLADEECIMLRRDLAVGFVKIQGYAVVEPDNMERPKRRRRRPTR